MILFWLSIIGLYSFIIWRLWVRGANKQCKISLTEFNKIDDENEHN